MIDLCTDCRRKHLGLASHHKLALGGHRLSGAGYARGEHPDMGSVRSVTAAFIDLFNLVCFGPDKRNSGMFVHLGGR